MSWRTWQNNWNIGNLRNNVSGSTHSPRLEFGWNSENNRKKGNFDWSLEILSQRTWQINWNIGNIRNNVSGPHILQDKSVDGIVRISGIKGIQKKNSKINCLNKLSFPNSSQLLWRRNNFHFFSAPPIFFLLFITKIICLNISRKS